MDKTPHFGHSNAIKELAGTGTDIPYLSFGMLDLSMDYIMEADPRNVFFRCVEDCNEAIMITDTKGKLTYVNPAWCQIYGYTREEAVGETPRLLHSGMHSPEFYKAMWSRIMDPNDGSWKGELVNRAKSGQFIPVLLTITPVRNQEGEIRGFMGIALDMTAEKQLEARVLQQDRLASVGMLASGLAHEIGTPMGVIRGRAEFLLMQATEHPSMRKGLEVIVTQIDRISTLISSLLRFSRTSAEAKLSAVCLNEVISEVRNLVDQNIKRAPAELKLDIPERFIVNGDFNQLQQIILNLFMNSVHAIQKAVAEGREGPHSIAISAAVKEVDGRSRAVLVVQDTGTGIHPEHMNKMFQPFFTTKDIGQGTGLGLAIIYKLIHDMGGDITVDGNYGKGAAFTIVLNPV